MTILWDAGSTTANDDDACPQREARLPVASRMDRSLTLLPGLCCPCRIVPANADLTARPARCRSPGASARTGHVATPDVHTAINVGSSSPLVCAPVPLR